MTAEISLRILVCDLRSIRVLPLAELNAKNSQPITTSNRYLCQHQQDKHPPTVIATDKMFSFFRRGSPQPPETAPQQTTQTTQPQPQKPPRPESEPELKLLNPETKYKLLLGGLTFFAFSLWTTRRALNRRYLASVPPFYSSAVYHKPDVSGGAEAFEALNLATLNVLSAGMAATGGVLFALDINGVDDLRRFVRRGFHSDGGDVTKVDKELEDEVEAWVGSVLGEKFGVELKKEKERERNESTGGGK
ncbi:hypothetical protein BDV28DRAFT_58237 [Aspergillus coremiiformis]|uniref:Altered inheritance of mitochondria protein 11 n=1 Tax=Aspergillus coremiiformis TaxID=138285 RepID=A0A5N6ZBW0_9EURO|nr:hypothetical protein BDV28DRAFT_58237 [Aspergillus coremiiformis]